MNNRWFTQSKAVIVLLIILALPAASVGANAGYSSQEYPANRITERVSQASTDPFIFLPIIARNYCSSGFYDDFSNPESGWPIFEDGDVLYEYLNGEYRILVKSVDYWWFGARPGFQAADYFVEVDVRKVSGPYSTFGIIFGLEEDWSHFYSFEIDLYGYYTIWRYSDKDGWKLLTQNYSPVIHQSSDVNRLNVKRDGSLIEVYANQHLLTTITDKTYTGLGYVGLIVSPGDQPNIDVRFDNFYVTPSECVGTTALSPSESRGRNSINPHIMFEEEPKKLD